MVSTTSFIALPSSTAMTCLFRRQDSAANLGVPSAFSTRTLALNDRVLVLSRGQLTMCRCSITRTTQQNLLTHDHRHWTVDLRYSDDDLAKDRTWSLLPGLVTWRNGANSVSMQEALDRIGYTTYSGGIGRSQDEVEVRWGKGPLKFQRLRSITFRLASRSSLEVRIRSWTAKKQAMLLLQQQKACDSGGVRTHDLFGCTSCWQCKRNVMTTTPPNQIFQSKI